MELVSQVASDNPLATLLGGSLTHERTGAPVDRELLLYGAAASLVALACAVVGRFWSLDMGTGDWVGGSVIQWGELSSFRLATPVGASALGALALDSVLASGVRVGEWARWACVLQVVGAALSAVPLFAAVAVVVVNIVIGIAIGIALMLLMLFVLIAALGS